MSNADIAGIRAKSLEELGKQIEDLVGQPIDQLPQPDHYAWWHPEKKNEDGSKGGYIVFKRGVAHPWMDKLVVTAMFRDEDEIRVYTLPGQQLPDGVWGVRRYCLSKKNGGSYEVENLSLPSFAQIIADEWVLVAEGVRSAERERNQIVAFLETLSEDVKASDAAEVVAQGAHWLEPPETPPSPVLNGVSETPSPSDPLPS